MKMILAIWLLVSVLLTVLMSIHDNDTSYETKKATTTLYSVQEAYVTFRSALNEALTNEYAYHQALECSKTLLEVFTMMDEYSPVAKSRERIHTHVIPDPYWEKAPREFFDKMRGTFAQPLDRLSPGSPPWHSGLTHYSKAYWSPYALNNIHFQKLPDRPVFEARFKEIRTAFECNTNALKQIEYVVSRRSDRELWRHLLDQVADYMTKASSPDVLPYHLPVDGTEKWTAWDISRSSSASSYSCLSSFLPWDVQSDDPAGGTLFIIVYRRSSSCVGRYVPSGVSDATDQLYAHNGAYVESANVVVGRFNPFEVYGVEVLHSETPPERTLGRGEIRAVVDDKELEEFFEKIRGDRREESK